MFDDLVFALTQQLEKPREALHQNVQALLHSWMDRHQIVTKEMLDQQQAKIDRLEQYITVLEQRINQL